LRLEREPPHPLLAQGAVRVSTVSGGTDAATVALSCTLTIERRMLPDQSADQVERELRTLLDAVGTDLPHFDYRLTCLVARGAFEANPAWRIVRTVGASAERVLARGSSPRAQREADRGRSSASRVHVATAP
jgi:acetylornithine deacetylase